MKIEIITYVKCDNYSAELQAFALQWKLILFWGGRCSSKIYSSQV